MKTSKSPESTEITPSKKKLKQARLPFKLISDVSPKPAAQQPRKRKLSTPNPESVTKIGKLSKENDLADDPVVISDDDCKNEETVEKSMNPFVKLVDTAFKKKQQKAKKRKNNKKKNNLQNASITNSVDNECEEKMDVDAPEKEPDSPDYESIGQDSTVTENSRNTEYLNQINKLSEDDKSGTDKVSDVLVLEESNDSENVILSSNGINSKKYEIKTDKNELNSETDKIENAEVSESEIENGDIDKDATLESASESDEKQEKFKITPKRSARNKAKVENESKLNESMSSTPSTPKTTRNSTTNSHGNDSMNESTNLTPKQLQKRLESAKKKEEREKEKQEREKKRLQDKEEKAKQRLEKEEQRKKEREEKEEAKKKEKEEKEEQKKKEREEKEKQKELEKKLKEEKEDQKRKEREEKEDQKRKEKEAKEEERRKKQEALELEKQEQELKKKKAAEAFANFFVPKQKVDKDQVADGPVSKNSMLSSFTIKIDMRLAPTVRHNLTEEKREILDKLMKQQNEKASYLKNLSDGVKTLSSGRTWPMDDKDDDDDVMIIEDELPPLGGAGEIITCEPAIREKLRPKLLSFHENRRPPYWGTWRKKSPFVKPRKPFGQDEKQLDYEVDSDDDWEEEQEGESIDGSAAGSDDEQDADEYEVDNEVFVPHGYLSDEEATMGEDDVLSLSPETQKAKLKHLEDEFESEMKKPTEKLKPRLYGLLWETVDGGKPEHCVDTLWNYFGKLSMIMDDPTLLLQPSKEPDEAEKKKVKKKKAQKKEEGEKDVIVEKKKRENKEKKPKVDSKKTLDVKKNQPGINSFLTKVNQSK